MSCSTPLSQQLGLFPGEDVFYTREEVFTFREKERRGMSRAAVGDIEMGDKVPLVAGSVEEEGFFEEARRMRKPE
jgi:hypothetical protein